MSNAVGRLFFAALLEGFMAGDKDKISRVKIRLRTGEEFEAEGDKYFIERQKDEFLTLIGKIQPAENGAGPSALPAAQRAARAFAPAQTRPGPEPPYPASFGLPREMRPVEKKTETPLFTPAAAEGRPAAAVSANASFIWNNACAAQGDIVVLRRKFKLLNQSLAALTLLAAAKVLLKENSYGSLKLAKSMKLSGFMDEGGERLDRILTAEIRQGTVTFEGEKRNRAYKISDEGFARAFVLAEKLV